MDKISVIIPVYNEKEGLRKVLGEISNLKEEFNIDEIIVVDDGCTDNTREVAGDFGAKVITHNVKRGYGASLKTGIRNARNEILVFLDGDGQHNPSDIKRMVAKLKEGNDLVIGERINTSKISGNRRVGKYFLRLITNIIAGTKMKDVNCGFRVTKKSMIEKYLGLLSDQFSFSVTSTIVFIKMEHQIAFCDIEARRRIGMSHVNQLKDGFNFIILVIRLIALFDPIRIFFSIAIFLFTIGMIYGGYKYLTVKQGLSVGALIVVLTGILSALLGIICDQISSFRLEKYK